MQNSKTYIKLSTLDTHVLNQDINPGTTKTLQGLDCFERTPNGKQNTLVAMRSTKWQSLIAINMECLPSKSTQEMYMPNTLPTSYIKWNICLIQIFILMTGTKIFMPFMLNKIYFMIHLDQSKMERQLIVEL